MSISRLFFVYDLPINVFIDPESGRVGTRGVSDVLSGPSASPLYEGGGRLSGRLRERTSCSGVRSLRLLGLAAKLWPWVDAAVADYAAGGVFNPDLAGKEYLSLLQRLRYVFLQDAALLQPQFPQLHFWRLALF